MAPRPAARRVGAAIRLGSRTLAPEDVERVALGARCTLAPEARRRAASARAVVERAIAGDDLVYGVNTGFGHLATVRIAREDLADLQRNLVRSHAAGVGRPLDERTVRAILALRAHCLARGHSGVRVATLERMVQLLDAGIVPIVPESGSVGASGDLAPLAHVALALVGEGEVVVHGRRRSARRALRASGLAPLTLEPKEGLALINGTQVMTAIGVLALLEAERLAVAADIVGAMSLEALLGSHRAFDVRVHRARPHPGQRRSAANLRRLLAHSALERSHRDCERVQDAYSLRCMPQVHGASRDALGYVRSVLEIEIDSSTDNPMVFAADGDMISGGNFHGQPVAAALDHLAVAAATLATISERRIERLVNPDLSGLPAFLTRDPGLHSGFMMAHVTAAALVSHNKVLAHPASVDTIPTSAAKEDHVSMGLLAARKARDVVEHVRAVLGIEALCAAQALDLRAPLRAGRGVEAARRELRRRVGGLGPDRVLAPDIAVASDCVVDVGFRAEVERACGRLA